VRDPFTNETLGQLCSAAMGDSFAAGTIDGPGAFDFTQGANSSNPFWHFVAGLLHKSTPEEKACQEPKGILLATGDINIPWPWAPDTVPIQMFRLGQLVILAVPTEMTTMAGRRLRKHLRATLIRLGVIGDKGTVVIAGLSNTYSDYTVTFEEYQQQRYEAGSTIFGPHQLNAYIQEFTRLAESMASGVPIPNQTAPVDFSSKLHSTRKNTSSDVLPSGAKAYGQVMADAASTYAKGDVVSVTYAGANPLHDLRTQGTYVEVQLCTDAACTAHTVVATDTDWETRITIKKASHDLGLYHSRTWTVEWFIPSGAEPGSYRVAIAGVSYNDPLVGKATFTPYAGSSKVFSVTA